jgi:hypothetical protein
LIHLLQHCPSSCAQYTPQNRWTVRNEWLQVAALESTPEKDLRISDTGE